MPNPLIPPEENPIADYIRDDAGRARAIFERATETWQGVRELMDIPALDMSPRELADIILSHEPDLEIQLHDQVPEKGLPVEKTYPFRVRRKLHKLVGGKATTWAFSLY
ncbi:hypothetical protein KKC44_00030 [Patescibacteria group bacterium]|nr:hypothetical protein [Patescibacteria group bacterium]MBU2258976.1 hypothetical protein [Patescibacteria group bacterium]